MTCEDPDAVAEAIESIHDHLEATAELPVERTATTYLGEAAAVAADAVAALRDGEETAALERIEQVGSLLSNLDTTGNVAADEHVAEAERLTRIVLDERDDAPAE